MGRLRLSAVVAVTATALLAAACVSPAPSPVPADGGPIPSGLDFVTMPWRTTDAPDLLAKLSAALVDPAFAESIDPAHRADALDAINTFLARPDARSLLETFISEQRAADAAQRASGRLPAPLSAAARSRIGLADPVDPPLSEPSTPTTVPTPDVAAPAADVEVYSNPSIQSVGALEPVDAILSGDVWPSPGSTGWAVGTGSKADKMAAAHAGRTTLDAAANCDTFDTGTRHLPSTPIPSFEGRIYTPTQGAFASSGAPGTPDPGVVTNYHGQLVTRMDPMGSGIRQMKVEAHLLSPTLDPVKTAAARLFNPSAPAVLANPEALRGHIVVERLDGTSVSYFPESPNTQWKTLCYAEDLGVNDVKRAYVEAWVPMRYPSVTDPRSLEEPGFQVRFESVDNFWNKASLTLPSFLYAAEQATVVLQGENAPIAHDAPVPGGSVAVRVADDVMVDRDGLAGNDLETLLRSKIEPAIGPALDSFDNTWIPLLALGTIIWVMDVKPGSSSLDLDISNIGPDDEAEFVGRFSLSGMRLRGAFASPVGACGFGVDVAGTINVTGQINRKTGDLTSLQIDGGHFLSGVSTSKTVVLGAGLVETGLCWAAWWGGTKVGLGALDSMARGRFDTLPDTKLSNTVDVNADDTVGPGVDNGTGGGFGITNVGFERSCAVKGCQGGEVLLDADGLAPAVGLTVNDKLPSAAARRFPVVYNPTLRTNLPTQYGSPKLPDQRPYLFGGFVHPTFINQVLRALVEGGTGPGSGTLDRSGSAGGYGFTVTAPVAPIFVNRADSPLDKPITLFIPDLRLSDGTNEFAVDATVGLDLGVDAPTRKLKASATVAVDIDTLQCGVSKAGPEGWVASYSLCANRDWAGDTSLALPSIPGAIEFVVNDLVRPLVEQSVAEVEVPKVDGFDFLSLGSTRVENVDGILSVFVGVPEPSLDLRLSTAGPVLQASAAATGLPGSGPITYNWTFEDQFGSHVLRPLGSGDVETDLVSSYAPSPTSLLFLRLYAARVTVTASRGGATQTATQVISWYRS